MTFDECKEHFADDAVYTAPNGDTHNAVIGLTATRGLVRIHLWKGSTQLTVSPSRLELVKGKSDG